MKQFIKYVFATMVGIFIIGVIISLSFIFGIVGMAATEGAATSVEENSVLVIKLEGSIEERTEENPLAMLSGSKKLEETGLDNILTAIQQIMIPAYHLTAADVKYLDTKAQSGPSYTYGILITRASNNPLLFSNLLH